MARAVDADKDAGLAQLVEQRFCKPKVAGSNPATGTTFLLLHIPTDKIAVGVCARASA